MQVYRKIIKKAILIVVSLIVLLLVILGLQTSKFGDIKKYDSKKSPRETVSKIIRSSTKSSSGMQVTIESNNIANLGDFVFNISGDRKLIANISLKYKSKKEDGSWFNNNNNEIEKEILKKSVILRDSTIDTMLGSSISTANSEKMRKTVKETLNKNLSNGEVEEVYFNQFIIQ